jgi:hypothetical protein
MLTTLARVKQIVTKRASASGERIGPFSLKTAVDTLKHALRLRLSACRTGRRRRDSLSIAGAEPLHSIAPERPPHAVATLAGEHLDPFFLSLYGSETETGA